VALGCTRKWAEIEIMRAREYLIDSLKSCQDPRGVVSSWKGAVELMECCWSPGTQQRICSHAPVSPYNILGKGLVIMLYMSSFLSHLVARRVMGQKLREPHFSDGICGARRMQQQN
jgi:hypothetical protein